MVYKLVSLFVIFFAAHAEPEDKKWTWGENNRERAKIADVRGEASARYSVYENENSYPEGGFGVGPTGLGPIPGQYPGSPGQYPGSGFNKPINIPGGVYDVNNQLYGDGHGQYYPNRPQLGAGVLTGPVPSWQAEGPLKEFDHCKCTERFNCNSPGISYGHCDVGKRYCCYSTKKGQFGGSLPSRPVHSIENGILVGPGGPVGGNSYPRPIGNFGGPFRPGSSGFGLVGRPAGPGYGGFGGQNGYSPENGILVGPGGPSNRPNFGFSPRSSVDKSA